MINFGLHVYFNKHARDNTSFSKRKVYGRSVETQKRNFAGACTFVLLIKIRKLSLTLLRVNIHVLQAKLPSSVL